MFESTCCVSVKARLRTMLQEGAVACCEPMCWAIYRQLFTARTGPLPFEWPAFFCDLLLVYSGMLMCAIKKAGKTQLLASIGVPAC